jgi:DeoR/GlpR family transcriptional regulator of sugar metabolism
MKAFDRRSAILENLQTQPRVSTEELSHLFEVSQVTIRKDLEILARSGWIIRRRGGAELPAQIAEQPFEFRTNLQRKEKDEIAKAASNLIHSGDQVILDGSTTSYQLALYLSGKRNITVITNNFHTAAALLNEAGIEILLVGGSMRSNTASTVGLMGIEMLKNLHAQKGFFSAAGFSLDHGLTDADIREVEIKRAMVAAVEEVNVLLDSSKFGKQALLPFAELDQVNNLVTDDRIPKKYALFCREIGIDIMIT